MTVQPPLPVAIERGSPRAVPVGYDALRDEGMALVPRYSGAVWTDLNEHDPGITMLEALCFALTELGYRTAFPIEDLIAPVPGEPGGGDLFIRPARLLASEPVTALDYRRLLIDRVPGLADAWLEPADEGLFNLALYGRPHLPGVLEPHRDEPALLHRARRVFVGSRGLGEDVAEIRALRPVPVRVRATVRIDRRTHPEAVMAELLYRAGHFLAPEPRRRSVANFPGESLVDLLEGPPLANGLIPESELRPRPAQILPSDLERHLSSTPGVLQVAGLRLSRTVVGPDECFALDAGLPADGSEGAEAAHLPIAVTHHDHPVPVDAWEVRRRLHRLWDEHRRTYRTAAEIGRAFPAPKGRPRDLASHEALAELFPAVYGIGPGGPGRDAPPARRGQARQLLGYLALFDRALVDYLDRLANLRAVFSAQPIDVSAIERRLADAAPTLAPVLIDGGPPGGGGRPGFPGEQQGRLLDFLLALYGEDLDNRIPRAHGTDGERHVREVKRLWLRDLTAIGRRRGRGLDYSAKRAAARASGLELRARLLLGTELEPVKRRRPRLLVVEHILLRRRRGTGIGTKAPTQKLSVVVHGGEHRHGDRGWRRQVCDMLRGQTPAHLALDVHFVDRREWVELKPLYRLWREAVRAANEEAVEVLSRQMEQHLAGLPASPDCG